MKSQICKISAGHCLLLLVFIFLSGGLCSTTVNAQPNISAKGSFSPGKVVRGRRARATVVLEIPHGYHVHSNRPLEKFLIATQLKVEAPDGLRVGPVSYPRALLRNLKFSKNRVAVYEGRVTMRFSIAVPRNFATGSTEIKAKVRYQSCDDEVCFPPQTKEVKLWLTVE